MKLRKVLSLLVAFAMILTASAAFAYTDVAVDSDAYEAVTGLSALNILTGYEDGTFAPEGKVKRSEMAAIIMRALGVNTSGQTNTIFSDVTAAHWASGAISEAFGAGIINGRSLQYAADGVTVVGGTFDPDAEVSYEEAVKMIVAAMGYNLKAEAMVKPGVNPFPTAYNLIADQKGITDGVEKTVGGATRATIAKLVWNALPVELMEQTAYGSQESFEEVETKSLLLTKLRAVLVEAKLDTLSLDPEEKTIVLSDVKIDSVADAAGIDDDVDFSTLDKGACDFAGLQGLEVKVLVNVKDKNNPVVIAAFPSSANKTLTVSAKLFVGMGGEESNVIQYYKSLDATTVNKSSKIDEDGVAVYVNLVASDEDFEDIAANGDYDVLRFVDTDNNGYYDTLFVDDYASFVVADADAESYTILADTDAYNSGEETEIVLDPEDEEVTWKMVDENGKELTVADVAVGDVLTYAKSTDGEFTYWDITVCKASAATGTIDQVKEVRNRAKGVEVYVYTIAGKDYQLNVADYVDGTPELNVGETGTFQITADGKIIAIKIDEAVRNFGLALAVKDDAASSWEKNISMMLLKADGTVETVKFADKFTVNDSEKLEESAKYDTGYDAELEDAIVAEGRVVMYELNASGEIKAVCYGDGIKDETTDYKVVEIDGAFAEASAKIDGNYLVEGSKVVALKVATVDAEGADDKANYSVITTGSLVDGKDYTGYAVVDGSKEVSLLVVENFVVNPAFDGAAMYVTGTSTVAVDGESRTKVFGIIGNEAVEYVLADDYSVVEMGEIADLADLSEERLVEGDVLQFTVNGAGEIDSYRPLVKVSDGKAKFLAISNDAEELKKEDNVDEAVEVALYAINTDKDEEFVLEVADIIALPEDADLEMFNGFGIVGYVNRVSGNNVGLFFPTEAFDADTDVEKDWLSDNYVDVAGDASVYAFVNSDAFGDGYDVKSISTIKTYASRGSVLSRTDDILYIFKYDDEVVLNYVIDVAGNN